MARVGAGTDVDVDTAVDVSRADGVLLADWPAPANVRAFTTLRCGPGVSLPPFDRCNLGNARAADGDDAASVASNRALLIETHALPSSPRWLRQVHGTDVLRFDDAVSMSGDKGSVSTTRCHSEHSGGSAQASACHPERSEGSASHVLQMSADGRSLAVLGMTGPLTLGMAAAGVTTDAFTSAATSILATHADEPVADAAVTSTSGTVLAILTADCLPVVFATRDGREVAAAHAGWRGLVDGVLEHTVAAMRASPDDVIAWLGPAAGPQAYEVGDEVREAFVSHDAQAATAFIATRPGHWRIDLYALARRRLHAAGVVDVYGGGLCTISDAARFHSYRRDGRSGRMATLVWIDPATSSR